MYILESDVLCIINDLFNKLTVSEYSSNGYCCIINSEYMLYLGNLKKKVKSVYRRKLSKLHIRLDYENSLIFENGLFTDGKFISTSQFLNQDDDFDNSIDIKEINSLNIKPLKHNISLSLNMIVNELKSISNRTINLSECEQSENDKALKALKEFDLDLGEFTFELDTFIDGLPGVYYDNYGFLLKSYFSIDHSKSVNKRCLDIIRNYSILNVLNHGYDRIYLSFKTIDT